MYSPTISVLAEKEVCWLAPPPEDGDAWRDVVLSSRIRLARNVKDCCFPARADDPALLEIRSGCAKALEGALTDLGGSCMAFPVDQLASSEREFLLECHYISREFLHPRTGAALLADPRQGIFVMVNEEDHLRFQALAPGMALRELWKKISLLDDRVSARLPYAFDPRYGYLTSCPSNLGTGMRASVMMHLPGLALAGQIPGVANALKTLKFALRGFYGEGSSPEGNLFQISNESTLGETEENLIARLERVCARLCACEKKTRLSLLEHKKELLLNFIGKSYGTARYAYSLKSAEGINALSGILLGAEMKILPFLAPEEVKRHLLLIQKEHLRRASERKENEFSPGEREVLRASLLREYLRKNEGPPAGGRKERG
ncbi:MAG: ATP--guanido phosphotransferase [Lentisphaeria bacterium]|nr:ATP--guanido phosphotransferase [Lentisphaeria bacterium]